MKNILVEKQLHSISDESLLLYVKEIETSLYFRTTTEELSIMLPFIKQFIIQINKFKDNKEFNEYEPLVSHSSHIQFETLIQYKEKWITSKKPDINLIIKNFPCTNSKKFLVFADADR